METEIHNLRELSTELKRIALEELNENPDTRVAVIQELREKYEREYGNDYPLLRKDDSFLIRFLRTKKFEVERALVVLRNYQKFRKENPEMFEDHREHVEIIKRCGFYGMLPGRCKRGSAVMYLHCENFNERNLTNFSIESLQKASIYISECLIEDENTQICGISLIEDLRGFSLFSYSKLGAADHEYQKKQFHWLQECFPARFKGIHVVNQPTYLSILMAVVKPFMKKKLRKRFYVHGSNYSSLFEFYDKKDVPNTIGGDLLFDPYSSLLFPGLN